MPIKIKIVYHNIIFSLRNSFESLGLRLRLRLRPRLRLRLRLRLRPRLRPRSSIKWRCFLIDDQETPYSSNIAFM